MKASDLQQFGDWVSHHDWAEVLIDNNVQSACDTFYNQLDSHMNQYFPIKKVKIHHRDKPWVIRKRQDAFIQGDKARWKLLRNQVQREIRNLKTEFYIGRVKHLKDENPASWYKHIKLLTGNRSPPLEVIHDSCEANPEDLDAHTAEKIKSFFADVNADIPPLDRNALPAYLPSVQPAKQVNVWQVYNELKRIKPGKSGGPDGIPGRLIREFAIFLATPLCHILNLSYATCSVPSCWKKAILVPLPKESPPVTIDNLRPISLTDHFAKIAELFIAKQVINNISAILDPMQYGCRTGLSTTHYLVDFINFLAKKADVPTNISTVVCTDFKKAFDHVSHTVAITKLIDLGVQPVVISWICDFLTEPSDHQDTLLNALSYLENRCEDNYVKLNAKKCVTFEVSFSKTTRSQPDIELCQETVQQVNDTKILGITIQDTLKWDKHVDAIVSRANRRLFMLRSLKPFSCPPEDMILVFTGFIRPVLEYACQVWHSSLTQQQAKTIEGVQKRALRIILSNQYISYQNALSVTDLQTLSERRVQLCLSFARSAFKLNAVHGWFAPAEQRRELRKQRVCVEPRSRTTRMKNSPVPFFHRLLNEYGL
ncbi:uncharacterized protein LOC135153732 [Lytechinus pictus]|uniref:uncharacterized protein LOC135153732 n=1 Tax=Lytechinus pictus TaxID=7653 RepID=UPI0030B9F35B